MAAAPGGPPYPPPRESPQRLKRVLEATYGDDPEKVWEVVIRDDADTNPTGYHVYRADRWPSLYDAID